METELYSTLDYSPGWYYKKWPGFYNVDCYKILSEYSYHPERFDPAVSMEKEDGIEEGGVEETKGDPAPEEQLIEEPQDPPPAPLKKRRRVKIKNQEESV